MPRFTFPAMEQRQVGDKLNVASKRFEWDGVKWKPVVTSGIPVEAPSINLIDTGSDYITVNFTNNDEDPVRFLYEIDDDTPDANILELNSGQTSSNITFSNLSQDTSYTIFLTPVIEGRVVESINLEKSTLRITQAPTISNTSRTHTSISFRINNPHDYEVTTYYEIGDSSPDANQVTISANSFQDITISGLSSNTSYTVYAFSIEADQVASNTISQSISTLTYTTATPTITITNVSADSVSFNLKNNDGSTVTMYYEVNDSTPDNTVTVNSGQTVSRTVSGLNGGTSYTVYARAQASNENMSSTRSAGFTTLDATIQANTLPFFGRGGSTTSSPYPVDVTGVYFVNTTDFVLPNYPQRMVIQGPNSSDWYPDGYAVNNLGIGDRFIMKAEITSGLPTTTNSCASPAQLQFYFADNEMHRVIGPGGNTPGNGCGSSSFSSPLITTSTNSNTGVQYTNYLWLQSGNSLTFEVDDNLNFYINGDLKKSGVALEQVTFYAGYTGSSSNSSNTYKMFGTITGVKTV